jgi:UDP-N-acetyl-D-mannosaminuronate dehydrogenase
LSSVRFLSSRCCGTRALTRIAVKKQVSIKSSALDACVKAEAIVIATEWKEFRQIAWEKVYEQMNKPAFVFDGRMIIDSDALRKIGFKVGLRLCSTPSES